MKKRILTVIMILMITIAFGVLSGCGGGGTSGTGSGTSGSGT